MKMSLSSTVESRNETHNSLWMPTLWEAISLKSWKVARWLFKVLFANYTPTGILTFAVWKLARVCTQEQPPPPRDRHWFWQTNFPPRKCSVCGISWKRSIRRAEVSVDWHAHPFQLRTEKPERPTAENLYRQSQSDLLRQRRWAIPGCLFSSHGWLGYSGLAFHLRAKLWAD